MRIACWQVDGLFVRDCCGWNRMELELELELELESESESVRVGRESRSFCFEKKDYGSRARLKSDLRTNE